MFNSPQGRFLINLSLMTTAFCNSILNLSVLLLANPIEPIIVDLNFSQAIAHVVKLGRLDQLNFLLSVFY